MASQFSAHDNTPHHGGLDRVIERTEAAQGVLSTIFAAKQLPTYALGLTIMAVVTLTERALDAVDTGFALEWATLSVVALVTFGLASKLVVSGTIAAQAWVSAARKASSIARADERLWDVAKRDPRVMNELLVAQGRAYALISEQPARVNSLRGDPSVNNAAHSSTELRFDAASNAALTQISRYY